MKAKVKTYLNERTQKPSVNAPNYHYYSPGDEIEIVDILNGDEYEGIDVWYKLDNDSFVWSGGVEGASMLTDIYSHSEFNIDKLWWLKDYHVDKLWDKGLTGKGVKVAIIDTGISLPHPDLNVSKTQCIDVTDSETSYLDQNGHGTHCAGIIKGSNNGLGINGIAYDCEIFSCKITHDNFLDSMEFLEKGIKWAIENDVDIINISKGFPKEERNIRKVITDARNKNISLVVAGGNNYKNTKFNKLFFPAIYDKCLAIGAVDENKDLIKETIVSNKEMLLAPGNNIKSSFLNKGYKNMSGTSQAAPFVTGILALLIQFLKENDINYKILKLEKLLIKTGYPSLQPNLSIINPSETIKLIENAPTTVN